MTAKTPAVFFDLVLGQRDNAFVTFVSATEDLGLEELMLLMASDTFDVSVLEGGVLRDRGPRLPVAVRAACRGNRRLFVKAMTARATADLDAGFVVATYMFFVVATLTFGGSQRRLFVSAVAGSALVCRFRRIMGTNRRQRPQGLLMTSRASDWRLVRRPKIVTRPALTPSASAVRARVQNQLRILMAFLALP